MGRERKERGRREKEGGREGERERERKRKKKGGRKGGRDGGRGRRRGREEKAGREEGREGEGGRTNEVRQMGTVHGVQKARKARTRILGDERRHAAKRRGTRGGRRERLSTSRKSRPSARRCAVPREVSGGRSVAASEAPR